MIRLKTIFVLLLCTMSTFMFAQSKDLKKADALYKLNKFAEAIPIFESAIQEKASLSTESKLAKCYFMLNKMDEAEQLYSKIVKNDKAKAITYFNYGETLMSKSKYEEAKLWFKRYLKEKPNDLNAKTKLLACDMVKNIQPYFEGVNIEIYPYNSEFDDTAPVFHNNELIFASDRKTGVKLLKQKSGWTGRDYISVYSSVKDGSGEYTEPSTVSKFNSVNKNTGSVSFSKDGKKAYFTRNGDVANKKNEYTMQLYEAESDDGVKWKNVKQMDICRVEYNYMHPSLSPDGKKLFFVSDKAGGQGGTDIYYSERNGDKWGKPQNIGSIINTEGNEGFPFLGSESKLYFSSKGHVGYGGFDIFYSEQKSSGLWKKPINIGKPINSSVDDISLFLLKDENGGFFTSSREGGDDDVFEFSFSGINSEVANGSSYQYDDEDADQSIFDDEPEVIVQQEAPKEVVEERPKTYSEILAMQKEGKVAPPKESKIKEEVVIEQPVVESEPIVEMVEEEIVQEVKVPSPVLKVEEPAIEKPIIEEPVIEISEDIVEVEKEEIIEEIKVEEVKAPVIPVREDVIEIEEELETEMEGEFDEVIETPSKSELVGQPELIEDIPSRATEPVETEIVKEVVMPTTAVIETVVEEEIDEIIEPEPIRFETKNNESASKIVSDDDLLVNKVSEPEPVFTAEEEVEEMVVEKSKEIVKPNPLNVPRSDVYVKENGVGVMAESLKGGSLLVGSTYKVTGANYSFNKTEVPQSLTVELDKLAIILAGNSQIAVELVGHTASFGQSDKNLQLSIDRAKIARDYLMNKGVSGDQITFNGFGESMLVNKCIDGVLCSLEEHKENERLEIVITRSK